MNKVTVVIIAIAIEFAIHVLGDLASNAIIERRKRRRK